MQNAGRVCGAEKWPPGIDSRAGAWYPVDMTCNTGSCTTAARQPFLVAKAWMFLYNEYDPTGAHHAPQDGRRNDDLDSLSAGQQHGGKLRRKDCHPVLRRGQGGRGQHPVRAVRAGYPPGGGAAAPPRPGHPGQKDLPAGPQRLRFPRQYVLGPADRGGAGPPQPAEELGRDPVRARSGRAGLHPPRRRVRRAGARPRRRLWRPAAAGGRLQDLRLERPLRRVRRPGRAVGDPVHLGHHRPQQGGHDQPPQPVRPHGLSPASSAPSRCCPCSMWRP